MPRAAARYALEARNSHLSGRESEEVYVRSESVRQYCGKMEGHREGEGRGEDSHLIWSVSQKKRAGGVEQEKDRHGRTPV